MLFCDYTNNKDNWSAAVAGAVEKISLYRNPVMPYRTKATIIYNVNQACRERAYLHGTPACMI